MSLDLLYSVNDLGVLLDPKLKFDSHIISSIKSSVNRRIMLGTIFVHNLINDP